MADTKPVRPYGVLTVYERLGVFAAYSKLRMCYLFTFIICMRRLIDLRSVNSDLDTPKVPIRLFSSLEGQKAPSIRSSPASFDQQFQ
jgi:hypothetical protein